MRKGSALTMRMVWIALVSGAAVLACSAPALIVSGLQNSENVGQSSACQQPDLADITVTSPLLPGFQEDQALLAPGLPRYDIQLSVDFDASTFQGLSVVTYTNTESLPLEGLYFRLFPNGQKSYGDGSLTVTDTTINGQAVETVSSLSDSVLEVRLPETLEPGDRTQIEFQFSGIVPRDFGSDPDSRGYGIYNKSEGVLALSGWYPLLAVYDEAGWNLDPVSAIGDSVYSETALYDVEVTTRKDIVLASSGVSAGVHEEGDNLRHHLVSGPVRDFFMIMSPDYQCRSRTVDGVRVNTYYQAEAAKGGERALAVASQAVRLFNNRFGSYPYAELDAVEAPLLYAQGVEYPTIVLIGSDLYQDLGVNFLADVVAHEVAHQWWYGLVGNDVIDDPWLDEALAMYSDAVYREETGGSVAYQVFIQYLKSEYNSLAKEGMDDRITQDLGYFEGLNNPRIYSIIVYSKGALFFDALRKEIGDDAFFQALQSYFFDQRYGVARPEDLLGAFETAAGHSLQDFNQSWLYTGGD